MAKKQKPLSYDARLELRPDGTAKFHGVDFELGRKQIRLVSRRADILVLQVPGRMVWNGNWSPRRYEPKEFMVYRILDEKGQLTAPGAGSELTVERLIDFPARGVKE